MAGGGAETWHARRIYEALRREIGSPLGMRVDEMVAADVRLLRRLTNLIAERAAACVGAEQRRGVRAREIARGLETKLPVMSRSLVQMFARTSLGRAETAFTRARAERAGLPWYVWTTSEDGRVRRSHRKMANVLVAWADPPVPEQLVGEPSPLGHYAPGVAYNCRCLARPLVDAGEVRWPPRLNRTQCTPQQARAGLAESAARCAELLAEALGGPAGRVEKFHRDGWAQPWPVGPEMLCYMLSHEARHRGQVCLLARQLGFPLPREAACGIWNWEKLWKH